MFYGGSKAGRPNWLCAASYKRRRVNIALSNARQRAKQQGLPFDLDTDYLLSIYPADNRCPALGIEMEFGGGKKHYHNNSPSIDRIVPDKGYVRGNVLWLSIKANRIKNNATTDEVIRVANFLKELNYPCQPSNRTLQ